jgi:lysophospholipase L1-like esterase
MNDHIIFPDEKAIRYCGRFDLSNPRMPSFDWTGVYIEFQLNGSYCKAVLSGKCRYDITIDRSLNRTITVDAAKDTFIIAEKLTNGSHTIRITKRTETNAHSCTFYGLILDSSGALIPGLPVPEKKIEFIGDSYTAGFGNEYTSRECPQGQCESILFMTTNTRKAFGPLVAASFGADYHVNAYSGKGVVRNYNGIGKGREFLEYYGKTLNSGSTTGVAPQLWDFSRWHPDVIVIGLGINDYLSDPPYADPVRFDSTYTAFLNFLRQKHPGVKMICCATDVWPTHALIPRIRNIVEQQYKLKKDDIWYFEYATENSALYGHPSVHDHKKIAQELQPLVAKITRWNYTPIP